MHDERYLRMIIRECILLEKKRRKKPKRRGSHPEEHYLDSTAKKLYLDRKFTSDTYATNPGGTVPTNVQLKKYFKKMGLLL